MGTKEQSSCFQFMVQFDIWLIEKPSTNFDMNIAHRQIQKCVIGSRGSRRFFLSRGGCFENIHLFVPPQQSDLPVIVCS